MFRAAGGSRTTPGGLWHARAVVCELRPERLICGGAAGAVARPEVGFQVLLGLPDVALGPMRLAFQQVALERLVVASAADTSKASETVYF